ncbi:amino acid ABC transporter ATP-binding protein [Fundidesulfovibrio soli]|uniref:amino acid ABC transporter ATP-binding protein n=1 Tax=Fundidesulfovibrio soli TaxID=2922716 RepID=UPI0023519273|nr:amino acid ABC transporter ATP-binding protein [Fundidesulfovibrio soli]
MRNADAAPLIECRSIRKHFGEHAALDDVSITVDRGDKVVIIGPSGSGKSTLLRSMNFLETIDSGEILFEGKPAGYRTVNGKLVLDNQKNLCALRTQIGMVFQQFNLFAHMTVLGNVMEGPVTVLGQQKAEARDLALAMLEKVGMADKAERFPATLSGGQKQRVAIARALAMRPKLMLFDEPTSALDPELVGEVFEAIKKLALEGMTMIIVTHNMGFAREVADSVAFMEDGRILLKDPPAEFFGKDCELPRIKSFIDRIM